MIDFQTIFSTSDSRSIFQVRSNFAHAVAVIQPSISLVIVFINKINTVLILPSSTNKHLSPTIIDHVTKKMAAACTFFQNAMRASTVHD